jgi:hypothetical protein
LKGCGINGGLLVDNLVQLPLDFPTLPPVTTKQKPARNLKVVKPSISLSISQEQIPNYKVVRNSRRKRGISAFRNMGVIEIHVPAKISKRAEAQIIPEMIELVLKREAKERKTDSQLMSMADQILNELLPDFHERPVSITWKAMSERWGSCTTIDRTIRISDRLQFAPDYVLRYILFHELIHLRTPFHDAIFDEYLVRFTKIECDRAESFLAGFEYASQNS